jgi:hypothetical protein
VLVFAYHVVGERARAEFDSLFSFRDAQYAFFGVWVDEYREAMQVRSSSWQTVSVPSRLFRDLRQPFEQFL